VLRELFDSLVFCCYLLFMCCLLVVLFDYVLSWCFNLLVLLLWVCGCVLFGIAGFVLFCLLFGVLVLAAGYSLLLVSLLFICVILVCL